MSKLYFDLILISICIIVLILLVLPFFKTNHRDTLFELTMKQLERDKQENIKWQINRNLEAERRNLLHRFKMFKDKCNYGWKENFYINQNRYYIDFSNIEDELFTGSTYYKTFELFGYFKNESDCDKAIELFGDEIKRYMWRCKRESTCRC